MKLSYLELQRLRNGSPANEEQMAALLDCYDVWGDCDIGPEELVNEGYVDGVDRGKEDMAALVDNVLSNLTEDQITSDSLRQLIQDLAS